ncbi:KH domain-containing protein, putative [Eimeria tenella]|uniref:KH domain-containing protein, putative n=1 Tax=Eimeria tenella TaxID=5802 RepID=U6KP27_EIMTE|nr:KH domain-containing protein, putative [Eimeria tenella]CDJ38027.1 KH domain-containing protein, putative [Eimeria tenella]|eukprot:XP_013228865.1 KH domain-containing protein, putative [Eimeria tenella]
MARKKRTDEEAAAGAAPAASTGGAAGHGAPKTSDAGQSNNSKAGAGGGQGRQNRKGGEAASRPGGAAPSSAATEGDRSAAARASSPKAGCGASKEVSREAEAASGNAESSPGSAAVARREIDMTGLSASQKKNLKKKLRKQEQKQQAAELSNALRVGAGAATLASRLNGMAQQWAKRVAELEASSAKVDTGAGVKQVYEAVELLQKEMQETLDEEVGRAKKPINKRATVQQVQEKIREAELTIQKQQKEQQKAAAMQSKAKGEAGAAEGGAATALQMEEAMRYLFHLKEQLVLTQQQSDLREFQQQIAELKASLDQIAKQTQRAAQQAASASDTRRAQQREGLLRRRLREVGAAIPEQSGAPLASVGVSLPPEASYILLTPQGQPSLLLRKVERKFGVLAEKKSAGDRGVALSLLSYSPDACEKCAAFLSACNFPQVPLGLATAPNCLSLEGQSIGAFIGTGGSNLRRLEAELDVLLWLEDKWITVLGHEAAVKKAIPHIKESRSPPSASDASLSVLKCEFEAEVVRAMAQGSAKTREKLQQLESSFGVTILVRPPRRGDPSKVAEVAVRSADLEACKKACAELENAFKGFSAKPVECDRLKANRILRGAAVDFSSIPGHELISLLRCDDGVLLVGPSEALAAAAEALGTAIDQLARTTEAVEIKATQLRILDRTKRQEIESLSGASCRPPLHEGEKVTLTFSGHPDAVQKAIELVHQTLEEQKEEELELSLAAALLFLVDKSHRALEDDHGLRIRVDVPRKCLIVRGGAGGLDAVADAIKRVEEEVSRSGKIAATLDVPREAVPLILGRQGVNVRRLQSECNLDNIVIDGRPQAVYLLGSQDAVQQATTMVQEIVANSAGSRAQNGVEGTDRRPRMGGRGGGRGGRNEAPGRGEEAAAARKKAGGGRPAAPAKPYNANVDDETAFPSLGVCTARPGGRWQKKSPAAEGEAHAATEAPAQATSDAQAEPEFAGADEAAN